MWTYFDQITQQQDANVKNYYIRDLGSAGGTFVRIAYGTRKQLHPGMCGSVECGNRLLSLL